MALQYAGAAKMPVGRRDIGFRIGVDVRDDLINVSNIAAAVTCGVRDQKTKPRVARAWKRNNEPVVGP